MFSNLYSAFFNTSDSDNDSLSFDKKNMASAPLLPEDDVEAPMHLPVSHAVVDEKLDTSAMTCKHTHKLYRYPYTDTKDSTCTVEKYILDHPDEYPGASVRHNHLFIRNVALEHVIDSYLLKYPDEEQHRFKVYGTEHNGHIDNTKEVGTCLTICAVPIVMGGIIACIVLFLPNMPCEQMVIVNSFDGAFNITTRYANNVCDIKPGFFNVGQQATITGSLKECEFTATNGITLTTNFYSVHAEGQTPEGEEAQIKTDQNNECTYYVLSKN